MRVGGMLTTIQALVHIFAWIFSLKNCLRVVAFDGFEGCTENALSHT